MRLVNISGQLLADSREVAEMINVRHGDLLEKISGYVHHLTNGKFRSLDFFIPNTYEDGKGESRPCFHLTRKGCDMVANKLTGEKGVLFTAEYVTRFEEMESQIKQYGIIVPQTMPEALRLIAAEMEEKQRVVTEKLMLEQRVKEYEPKISYLDSILKSTDTVAITQIAKDYGLSGQALNKILHEEKVQYNLNGQWLLYQKHQDKGFTKSQTIDVHHTNGTKTVKMNTKWTQKGRLFIHETLTKRGIVPYMDREQKNSEVL